MHLGLSINRCATTGVAHTCVSGRTVRMCCTRVSFLCVLTARHIAEVERRRITATDEIDNTPNSTSLQMRADCLTLKRLAAQGGCALAIKTSATTVAAIKFAGV